MDETMARREFIAALALAGCSASLVAQTAVSPAPTAVPVSKVPAPGPPSTSAAPTAGPTMPLSAVPDAAPTPGVEERLRDQRRQFEKREMRDRAGLVKALVAKHGSGIVNDIRAFTVESVRDRIAAATLPSRDLDGVFELMWKETADGFAFEVTERSAAVLQVRVTRCYLAEEMRRLGASAAGEAFYCAWDNGFCQGLNPKIRFTRTKTLMAGDDCCNHRYELTTG